MLIVILLSSYPVFAAKFNLGDTVEVFNTGASGLVVRDAPAGNYIGGKYDGNRGVVLAGPQSASLGGVVYTWWKVRWSDDALEGWSAENWLMKVAPPDLIVEDIWIEPDPPSPGGLTHWGFRIRNQGAGDATGTFYLECYFDNTYGGHVTLYGLSAGSAYTTYWQYMTWPSNTNPHVIKGVVDPGNSISESNEYNNVWSESFQATAPPPPNQSPTIYNGYVTPSSGDTSTTFSYYVTYSDPEGDLPTTKYVYIDGSPRTMAYISGSYISGAVFRYSTTLSAGSHNYYFYFADSFHSHVVRLPTTGTYPGPTYPPPPTPDFSVTSSPTSLTIQKGSSGTSTITITSINGFNQPVQLTVSGLPSGVTPHWESQQVTPPAGGSKTSNLLFSAEIDATPGNYLLTVTGTCNTLVHDTHISLEITETEPVNYPPVCAVELQEDGVEISKIDVGRFFYIHVGNSAGDVGSVDDEGIVKVRFSSDDVFDPFPTGVWTEWYDWDSSLDDWDATTKIRRWAFYTPGNKDVWAEVIDDIGQTDKCHAQIFANPGYAIVVAGAAGFWKLGCAIDFNANNVYRVLRNLGFDDEHVYYLARAPQDIDDDGDDEVDAYPSRGNFINAIQWARQRVNENTQFILYLIGHGYNDPIADTTAMFFLDQPNSEIINPQDLNGFLADFPEQTPTFIGIDACYSGVFIKNEGQGTISVPSHKRVIITSAHDDQEKYGTGIFEYIHGRVMFYSDDLWRNLNKGLTLKGAFVETGDAGHAWLDDNGDALPSTPYTMEVWGDGELAETMHLGVPGTQNLPLKPFVMAFWFSPIELTVFDSNGWITGLVNGEVREEIPNSFYIPGNKTVVIIDALDAYRYEIVGTDAGTYGLSLISTETGNLQIFNATEIPTVSAAFHRYTVDWEALSLGEEGVTLQVDSDGDGVFEHTFTSDSELTQSEFLAQTIPPPLSVSISPLSASLLVSHSVTFTSTALGGVTPYTYQWFVNNVPVSGATSTSWTFASSVSGTYYVYLKVTDASSNTSQSETARITVRTTIVGGHSVVINPPTKAEPVLPYIALIAALTAIFTKLKSRTGRRKTLKS